MSGLVMNISSSITFLILVTNFFDMASKCKGSLLDLSFPWEDSHIRKGETIHSTYDHQRAIQRGARVQSPCIQIQML